MLLACCNQVHQTFLTHLDETRDLQWNCMIILPSKSRRFLGISFLFLSLYFAQPPGDSKGKSVIPLEPWPIFSKTRYLPHAWNCSQDLLPWDCFRVQTTRCSSMGFVGNTVPVPFRWAEVHSTMPGGTQMNTGELSFPSISSKLSGRATTGPFSFSSTS